MRDGEAAERLHQRPGAMGGARPAVRFLLQVGDIGTEARAHRVLEREGLDDADALQGLLHGFEDVRAASELLLGDRIDAADHPAQEIERRRDDEEGDERHHRLLHHHHGDERDEREEVAANGADDEIERLARGRRAGRQPREELRRVPVGEIGEVLMNERGKDPALIVGDDAVGDLRQLHGQR